MSYHLLRDASDEYMLQTGQSVRRCDNQVDVVIFCDVANVHDRRTLGKNCLKFCGSEVHRADKFLHLALGIFTSGLLQAANVVDGRAVTRINVSEPCGMEQNHLGPKLIGKPDRVLQTLL